MSERKLSYFERKKKDIDIYHTATSRPQNEFVTFLRYRRKLNHMMSPYTKNNSKTIVSSRLPPNFWNYTTAWDVDIPMLYDNYCEFLDDGGELELQIEKLMKCNYIAVDTEGITNHSYLGINSVFTSKKLLNETTNCPPNQVNKNIVIFLKYRCCNINFKLKCTGY